ncbi:MAG: hypothetical protein QM687_15490 [Ferruginibacter sp.]
MSKITKIVLLLFVMNGLMLSSWADRGVGKKKTKVNLNLTNPRTTSTTSFTLKSGVKYKGSLLTNTEESKTSFTSNSTVSYQKGNTIYIIPYKQKVVVPEMKQGYTGVKLILQTKL